MKKEDLLRLIVKVAKRARVKMGIGGGIAVAAHGYRRETQDVDAFFHAKDRRKVLGTLRRLAPKFRIEELHTSHWIAVAPDADEDERIDLMFAIGDPEESAIELARTKTYRKISAPVFPVDMLVATKYLANRGEPKDALDIVALYQRGAFEIGQVTKRLRQMGNSAEAAEFPQFVKDLIEITAKRKKEN